MRKVVVVQITFPMNEEFVTGRSNRIKEDPPVGSRGLGQLGEVLSKIYSYCLEACDSLCVYAVGITGWTGQQSEGDSAMQTWHTESSGGRKLKF